MFLPQTPEAIKSLGIERLEKDSEPAIFGEMPPKEGLHNLAMKTALKLDISTGERFQPAQNVSSQSV
jgi:hypothetical protein